MNPDIPTLVQTSLNVGIMTCEDSLLNLQYTVRSSVGDEKEKLIQEITTIAEEEGASIERNGEYPAWEYQKDSPLRAKMMRIYEEMFGKIPTVEVDSCRTGMWYSFHEDSESGLCFHRTKYL